ncbi:MAG: ABC transporter permease [Caldilineaceae bacterium]|nr:ABC transporter permease [Caldilineaceae bacterium]
MRKIWLVAWSTYLRRVRSGAFLGLTFGLPLIMLLAGSIPFWLATRTPPAGTLGIVDQTGTLGDLATLPMPEPDLTLALYPDIETATTAVEQTAIQGFLVIPTGYATGEAVRFYGAASLNERWQAALAHLLRQALYPSASEALLARLAEPTVITYVDAAHGVVVAQGPAFLIRTFFSSALALVFALIVFTGISQLGAAIVREKEQRALEMVLTSLSIQELVAGKVFGMSLLSLTQLGVWGLGALLAVALAAAGDLSVPLISIPWSVIGWAFLFCLPGYFLYATISAGLGILAGDSQQAQQLAGMLGFFTVAPFWLLGVVAGSPNGLLAAALTFFPLTAPMFSLIRMSLTVVPVWQLFASLMLLLLTLLLSLWAVARIFRTAMLLYGQRLRPRTLWQALRSA